MAVIEVCVRPGCRGVKVGQHCESPTCNWLKFACGAIYSLTRGYGWGCSTNPDSRERTR